jgi:hypothetical protein
MTCRANILTTARLDCLTDLPEQSLVGGIHLAVFAQTNLLESVGKSLGKLNDALGILVGGHLSPSRELLR